MSEFSLRVATLDDCAAIERLIAKSIRALGAGDYTSEQIEQALKGAFGLDTQLIKDQTYFIAEVDGRIAGCGGWSKRKTLFGSDARNGRDAGVLEPGKDAAKIRAFFVDPEFARRGIGAALLKRCEDEASKAGYNGYEMMATLPGVRLYSMFGYVASPSIQHPLTDGLTIEFVPMHKQGRPLTFRKAVHEDAEVIAAIVNSGYRGDASRAGWTTEADLLVGKRTDADEIKKLIADPNTMLLLCLDGATIIGSVQLDRTGTHAYLGMFVVKPELQGRGVGKQFIQAAEETTRREWGAKKMQMSVITLREELIAYYVRRGYRRTGTFKPFPVEDTRSTLTVPSLQLEILEKTF